MSGKKRIIAIIMMLTMLMSLVACADEAETAPESDLEYIREKGTLVVGVTDFAPMDYRDENGEWIGFDADMAAAFADSIGVELRLVEIDWDNREISLDSKVVDCLWNGMTITDEAIFAMSCSNAYCRNSQIVVVTNDNADLYNSMDAVRKLTFAVEAGSAAEDVAVDGDYDYIPVATQADALKAVAKGQVDAAIVDSMMAIATVGDGTEYENLTCTVELSCEQYGVGVRKNSDLRDAINEFLIESYSDGTMIECADRYDITDALDPQIGVPQPE